MNSTSRKFNTEQLQDKIIAKELEMKIDGAFEPLLNLETSVDDLCELFKKKTNAITKVLVSYKRPRLLVEMNPEVPELCDKNQKAGLNFVKKTASLEYRQRYQNLNKQVRKAVKKSKKKT